MGTPKTCLACHNGDPTYQTIGRSTKHIPTDLINCGSCHNTLAFTPYSVTSPIMHSYLSGKPCIMCHLTGLSYTGGAQKMSLTHHQKTPVPTDCSMSGCHRPLGTVGKLYTQWDN